MKILIKYPTKGRPELFKQAIKNIHETISGEHEYQIHVTCDFGDASMVPFLSPSNITSYKNVYYNIGLSNSKIHAINRDMDIITENYDWDLLVVMSDDMRFISKDWDKRFVEEALRYPDHLYHWADGFVNEALPTLCVMDRAYYERFFYIYPNCYKSFSCDAEQMFVAQMIGRWKYFPEVLFNHLHPANIVGMPTDKTYTDADLHAKRDTEIYFKRLKKLFNVNRPLTIPEQMKPYL